MTETAAMKIVSLRIDEQLKRRVQLYALRREISTGEAMRQLMISALNTCDAREQAIKPAGAR